MTDQQAEIFSLLYALGDAIRIKDWPTAVPLWERLLELHTPLADYQPELAKVLRRNAAMVQAAGRQTSHIH